MNKLAISIIIPAYNEERYLGACLDAIAALELAPHEVIVVDNGSTDKTAKVARRYPFVRLLHEPRRGRVFARNAGFDAATGTILARIDADAVLSQDWTKRVAMHFARSGALQTAWTGGPLFYNVRFPRVVSAVYAWLAFRLNALLIGCPTLWGSSMAMPRGMWQKVRGHVCARNDIHEDLDLTIHLHHAGCKIVYDKRTKVGVELRPIYARRTDLWDYVLWWPRTLQVHGLRGWLPVWLVSVLGMYPAMLAFRWAGNLMRAIRRLTRP